MVLLTMSDLVNKSRETASLEQIERDVVCQKVQFNLLKLEIASFHVRKKLEVF